MPKITLPGVSLEDVPKSAIALVAVLFACSVIGLGWWTQVRKPELELVSAREATEAAMLDVEELGKHIGEKAVSEYTLSDEPLMLARLYKDRCILLVSDTPEGVRSKLVRDMARDPHKLPKHGSVWSLPVVEAAPAPATRCDGMIHPPPFDTKYGVKQGCWVPVYRIYRDGCVSVTMFDSCNGIMDGRTAWTICRH